MSDDADTNPEVLEEDLPAIESSEPPSDSNINFRDLPAFNSDTDPSDDDFDPLLFEGWNGKWTPPDDTRIEFDKQMLAKINGILKRICMPTWIRRAIPCLGKASFGKLKADEWRTLMTLQLPLILVPMWSSTTHDTQFNSSLLKNFAHLVSLTNLALKRSMTSQRIEQFQNHTRCYLESSLVLFPHCSLATNHHIVSHLAECLKKFGPVRSWWSYPFERLMRRVLLSNHNNHVGELEITFMKTFGRAGNLSALLKEGEFPSEVQPYLPQLRSLLDPLPPQRKTEPIHDLQPLNEELFLQLIDKLNDKQFEGRSWLSSQMWSALSPAGRRGYSPTVAQAKFHKRYKHATQSDVKFSIFSVQPSDAIVEVLIKETGVTRFGKITSIFTHGRVPVQTKPVYVAQ
ncbi:uncharacterized protein MELLADRAFT_91315 [Melampsora larici-populina 98AG31]|uniref:DUF4218 domain-containing protein n=1 Tax=Melampsora larici-populina (strain 98AG31 / pathotype 3-4-7) TaxID=747676 RepID=F4RYL8_MELLP|nr:uncharacterized protein MELLADRAFT_91315 [Melampsora larici-populina 98AG31]EGG02555.1 hypothetical protein MELLADRAFT_91315 [Melampsora larici-populina 98AG31]